MTVVWSCKGSSSLPAPTGRRRQIPHIARAVMLVLVMEGVLVWFMFIFAEGVTAGCW